MSLRAVTTCPIGDCFSGVLAVPLCRWGSSNSEGFQVLFDNAVEQFYAKWLKQRPADAAK